VRDWLGPGVLDRIREGGRPGAEGRAATTLLSWPGGGPELLVRSLHHGGWLGGLLGTRFLDLWRPVRELVVTAALHARGVPVPEPAFAAGERRSGSWRLALATGAETDVGDGIAFLSRPREPATVLRATASAGRAIRAFHDAGGLHADLHVKNLLVRLASDGSDVLVIDLDQATLGSPPQPAARMRQLMRLYRSLEKRDLLAPVGARGLAVFLAAYCAGDRELRAALLRHRDAELRRIAWHRLTWPRLAGRR